MSRISTWVCLIIVSLSYPAFDVNYGDGSYGFRTVAASVYWGGLSLFTHWLMNKGNSDGQDDN